MKRKGKYFFNLDVYEDDGDKHIKVKNIPIKYLDELIENIKNKFG